MLIQAYPNKRHKGLWKYGLNNRPLVDIETNILSCWHSYRLCVCPDPNLGNQEASYEFAHKSYDFFDPCFGIIVSTCIYGYGVSELIFPVLLHALLERQSRPFLHRMMLLVWLYRFCCKKSTNENRGVYARVNLG